MRIRGIGLAVFGLSALLFSASAQAGLLFIASLDGASERPNPVDTDGRGFGRVWLNDTEDMITVDLNFRDLTEGTTAAHIHGPADTESTAGILFPLDLGSTLGQTSGAIATQQFAIDPTEVGYLKSGLLYFNVHTSFAPPGEIRGQIVEVPEPSSLALVGFASIAGVGLAWRRRRINRR